jgi:hypothetical protein
MLAAKMTNNLPSPLFWNNYPTNLWLIGGKRFVHRVVTTVLALPFDEDGQLGAASQPEPPFASFREFMKDLYSQRYAQLSTTIPEVRHTFEGDFKGINLYCDDNLFRLSKHSVEERTTILNKLDNDYANDKLEKKLIEMFTKTTTPARRSIWLMNWVEEVALQLVKDVVLVPRFLHDLVECGEFS